MFDQLNLIEEKRMMTLCHGQLYQKRMKKDFDKKVKPHELREGDLVLRKIMSFNADSRGKWTPNFEGPYVVKKIMKKAFDKKVKPREFREGDLVLRKIMSFNADSRGQVDSPF